MTEPAISSSPPDAKLRVLFSVRPFRGHLHPLVPLARAFRRAGHRVAVATGDDVAQIVTGAGLAWLPAGLNPRQVPEVFPDDDPDYGYRVVRAKVEDLLDISIGQFRPDVIVRDPTDLAPIIVSEIVGAVDVIYGLSRFIPPSSWTILGADRTITRLRRAYKLRVDRQLKCMYDDLYLAVLPKSMEVHAPLPVPALQPVRYVPWDGIREEWAPAAQHDRSDRPTVLVSLGTVYNTNIDLFRRFIEALGGEGIDVICTLGETPDPTVFDFAPPNVQFERYRPHSSILPRCRALVCHGGFNTVMGALVAGVPLVCVPLGSDQYYNANRCAANGFGIALDERDADPERIRSAVRRVLDESSFSARVRAFQGQMAKRPGLPAAVRRIERLVAMKGSARRLTFGA